jgi:hypothetical protein
MVTLTYPGDFPVGRIDPDGLVYKAGEIATLPFLHAQIAELRKQLDKARCTESLGHIGFFEVTDALRGVLEDGVGCSRRLRRFLGERRFGLVKMLGGITCRVHGTLILLRPQQLSLIRTTISSSVEMNVKPAAKAINTPSIRAFGPSAVFQPERT